MSHYIEKIVLSDLKTLHPKPPATPRLGGILAYIPSGKTDSAHPYISVSANSATPFVYRVPVLSAALLRHPQQQFIVVNRTVCAEVLTLYNPSGAAVTICFYWR